MPSYIPTDTPLSLSELEDLLTASATPNNDKPLASKEQSAEQELIKVINLPEGEIDPRLKLLSHSSRTTLHKCPRKYQLYRLSSDRIVPADNSKLIEQEITFSYGTIVGAGMQDVLEGKSDNEIILHAFLNWKADLEDNNPKQKKSFWLALAAITKFMSCRNRGLLKDYDLVYLDNGKPAVELAFQIILPGGFKYRGFVDAVLRHRLTGEILVLEGKTSSGTAQPAMFKNSGQALGYSVVLDILFPKLSSYSVLYLVYETKSFTYKELTFTKSLLHRALWLQELIIDVDLVNLYDSYDIYPTHGESCYDFFKDCEYLGLCSLDNSYLTKPLTQKILNSIEEENEKYDFSITFDEIVEAQINKGLEDTAENIL